MYYPYYFDYSYLIFILPALLFAMWAQFRVHSTFGRYSRQRGSRHITGQEVARMILDQNGLYNVKVETTAGQLTDHYDPKTEVVRLSESVYNSDSISAIGVAAHECGHAVQHAEDYGPMKLRAAVIPITNIGSNLAIPLLLVGMLFSIYPLIWVGILGYVAVAVFQLITLPVEFNASSRALSVIETNYVLEEDELRGARKVLSAAALTYVAALAASVAQILRLLFLFGGRRSRR